MGGLKSIGSEIFSTRKGVSLAGVKFPCRLLSLVLLGMGFFTSCTFCSAATNIGTFKATCQSFMLLPSLSADANGEPITTSFTSLNNYFGFPPWLFDLASGKRIFSGECKPYGEGYGAYYVHEKPGTNNSLEWGALQFQIPSADLDGNGLLDFLEPAHPGNAAVVGNWFRDLGNDEFEFGSVTGAFTRAAGSLIGTYSFCLSNATSCTSITGAMRLATICGALTISRGGNGSICLDATWTDAQGHQNIPKDCLRENISFSVPNSDTIQIEDLAFGATTEVPSLVFGSMLLNRDGPFFRARGKIADVPETPWADYEDWDIEFWAPADTDGNGVPDLSDFVPGFPYIRRQPASIRVTEGSKSFLSIDAGGMEPLSYQWWFNSAPLAGSTNRVLQFSSTTTNQVGSYSVLVSNEAGIVLSSSAYLTTTPAIVSQAQFSAVFDLVPGGKLLFDSQGNLITPGIRKYSPEGLNLWSASVPSQDFATDTNGSVYATGSDIGTNGYWDIFTTKLDSLGQLVWSNRYNGPAAMDDQSVAIRLDGSGNVFVAGTSQDTNGQLNHLLLKYDPAGHLQWERRYQPDCVDNGLRGLAVSKDGDAYIAGYGATLKFDSSGNLLWVRACTNFGNISLALDSSGDLLEGVSSFGPRYGILKSNPAGQKLWSIGLTNGSDFTFLAVDGSNNVYVSAQQGQILKLQPNGAVEWTSPKPVSLPAEISRVAALVDGTGALYWTGTIRDNTSTRLTDIYTSKLSPAGAILWSQRYSGTPDTDQAFSIAIDGDGELYVGGLLERSWPVVLKYSQYPAGASIKPLRQTVPFGATVTLNASYRGNTHPLSYQWRFGNTNIPGATSSTLIREQVGVSESGIYSVVITDSLGNQSSAESHLIVQPPLEHRFISATWGGFMLQGPPGAYSIEYSTDLTSWTSYTVLEASNVYLPPFPVEPHPYLFLRTVRLP